MTDLAPAEARTVFLPALCWNRQHSDFYAVTDAISARGIGFRSSVVPAIGDGLTCNISYIGMLDVRVVETASNAFLARLAVSRERAEDVARTMMALAREQQPPAEQIRRHRRIAPEHQDLLVTLADGSVLKGRLINVSVSGAAVALATPVAVGADVALGSTPGQVVRCFEEGIGVVFATPLDPHRLHEGIRL